MKILSFQTSEATTYEHAVGMKNTERKNACPRVMLLTSSASPSEIATVVGTINTANNKNVVIDWRKAESWIMVM